MYKLRNAWPPLERRKRPILYKLEDVLPKTQTSTRAREYREGHTSMGLYRSKLSDQDISIQIRSAIRRGKGYDLDTNKAIDRDKLASYAHRTDDLGIASASETRCAEWTTKLTKVVSDADRAVGKIWNVLIIMPTDRWLSLGSSKLIQSSAGKKHVDRRFRIVAGAKYSSKTFKQVVATIEHELTHHDRHLRDCTPIRTALRAIARFTGRNPDPEVPTVLRTFLATTYPNDRCFCCDGRMGADWECGHVLSAEHGGSNALDNLRRLCRACNRTMGAIHLYEYIVMHDKKGVRNLDRASLTFYRQLVEEAQKAQAKVLKIEFRAYFTLEQVRAIEKGLKPKKVPPVLRMGLVKAILSF
jgi:hypothetical protein